MAISDYLTQLQTDKQNLVDNLNTQGVTATSDETFTSLVPKVLDIEGGSSFEITDASYFFYNGARIDALNELSSLLKKATNMSYMFYYCSNLTSLDLSNFDTSSVTNYTNMFYKCSSLETVYVKNETVKDFIDARLSDAGLSITSTIKSE